VHPLLAGGAIPATSASARSPHYPAPCKAAGTWVATIVREAAASAWAATGWPPAGEATIDHRTGMAPNAPVPMAGEPVMGT
jgi:hypothetical protein